MAIPSLPGYIINSFLGYAADGYARVRGIGAIITTFGVGELSAINGLAGAYSEYVPVVHIVGTPSTISQRDGMLLHHTLGNGNFNAFADMSANVSVEVAKLNDPSSAATLIDHAIRECWLQSRPVYITLPTDIVQKKIEGERLKSPLDLTYPENDQEKEDYVVDVVLRYLHAAKNPVILVDACAQRHRVLEETHALIEKSGLPTFVAPMGKGAVNETLPNYGGVYAGDGSNAGVREQVEKSDLVLSIGAIKSDFNTAGFTYRVSQLSTIDFHSNYVRVRYSEYPGVRMRGVLKKVVERMGKLNVQSSTSQISNTIPDKEALTSSTSTSQPQPITHDWLWPRIGQWLQPSDIVVTETGTANFGIWETKFPAHVTAISQVLWGSIGYSVGATQGAALAAKETAAEAAASGKATSRRTILFVGDGSFQLGAQELSTMIRQKLSITIFLICNNGYTIERYIHGMEATYNDVNNWKYKDLIDVFNGQEVGAKTYQIRTKQEAEDLLKDEAFSGGGGGGDGKDGGLKFVELYMPMEDAPKALRLTAEASAENNARQG